MGPSSTIRLNLELVGRLLHAAAERVDDKDSLLYCLLEAWEEHRESKIDKNVTNEAHRIRRFESIPYHSVPDIIPRRTVLEDWTQILEFIDNKKS